MKSFFGVPTFLLAVLLPSAGGTAMIDESRTVLPDQPPKTPSSRMLTHVDLKQNGTDATVMITGDGRLSYRIRSLDRERVIVDLVNTSTRLPHAFEFTNPVVKQIRIGQHPHMLRLVIDLRKASAYSVEEGTSILSITLAPRTDMPQSAPTAMDALPRRSIEPLGSIAQGEPANTIDHSSAQDTAQRPIVSPSVSARLVSDPQPRQDGRNRGIDRRTVDQPMTQSANELYAAVFGGASLSQSFTDVHGVGANASVKVSDLALARSGIGGVKLGFSPAGAQWLALETELFYSSPHIKQQSVTATGASGTATTDVPGSHTRMTTWAFNWILRYPGERIQPYVGAGLGIFWGRLADSGGTSSSDTSPGLNALAGLRAKIGQHFLLFTEYKYNRASFDFSSADFHVLYQAHYIVGGLGWSF